MSSFLSEFDIKRLFEQFYPGLVEFSSRLVYCQESARDIVQDVFVKLLVDDTLVLKDEHYLKTYLYSMVKNACFNELRKQEVKSRYLEYQKRTDSEEEDILEALIYAESINQLYAAIETLPEACRKVCNITYIEEKSNSEAAEITETSINTIKTHKRRALELLRKQIIPSIKAIKTFFLFFF